MTLEELKARAIEDGIEEVTRVYADAAYKREGAIAGFEHCRDLHTPDEFQAAIAERHQAEMLLRDQDVSMEVYWRDVYHRLQLEWIFSLLDVHWRTRPYLSGRAVEQYARLVGVAGATTP